MNKAKRTAVIAGNWKMNMTPAEAKALVAGLLENVEKGFCKKGVKVVFCVPFTDIATVKEATGGTCFKTGAQNVHWAEKGAFTGEISADMLLESGAEYVIIGHSERRQYFGETDETVNMRVKAALAKGLKVILCVGETETMREQGITEETVSKQTKIALLGVEKAQLENIIIAYEPVWAIGTGKTATDEQAEEVCAYIRKVIGSLYGEDAAEAATIQYGGSMNAKNAASLLSMPDIDGGLIGGASLKPADFAVIVKAAAEG